MSGITDPNEKYFKNGVWGYYNGIWRPGGLPFAISGVVKGLDSDLNAGGGGNFLYGDTVPDGYLWVITGMMVFNYTGAVSSAYLGYESDSTVYWVHVTGTLAAREGLSWSGALVLEPGDRTVGYLIGCTAGDDIYFYYNGYSIEVS